jgi:C-terminal processing protease CtpA/Prc
MDYSDNDEMRVARPERLAEIVAIQGIPAERWILDSVLPEIGGAGRTDRWHRAVRSMLEGPRGTALHLMLKLPGGATRGASVTRSVSLGARWPLRRTPLEVDTLSDRTVVVRLNDFDDPDFVKDFDRAFPDFGGVKGMLLDLRANASTTSETGYAVLARLVSRPFLAVRRRAPHVGPDSTTWRDTEPDTVQPRSDRPVFTGPLAALSGEGTADAGEDFLVALRNASRGPIVGDPTAGHGGRAATMTLARGWRFELCVTRHAFPDGAEFVEVGIAPEQRVPTTIEDVLKGRDAPLERAREYLATRAGP